MGEKPTAADEAMEQGRVRESPTRPSHGRVAVEEPGVIDNLTGGTTPSELGIGEMRDYEAEGIAVDEPGVIDNLAGQPSDQAGTNLNSSKSNLYRTPEEPPQGDQPSGLAVSDPGATGSKDPKKS